MDYKFATNDANLMISVSFERRDCQLLIDCPIVNFGQIVGNLQSNQTDSQCY